MERPTWYIWTKTEIEIVIPNFLYKPVKTLYLLFYDNKKIKIKIIFIIIIIIIK